VTTRIDEAGEGQKALDRIRTIQGRWLARESLHAPPPILSGLPQPAPELLQAMHEKRMATPERARLDDLIRGQIPKLLPDGHKHHRPQIAERHPIGLFREHQQRSR